MRGFEVSSSSISQKLRSRRKHRTDLDCGFTFPPPKFSLIEVKIAFAAVTDFQSREKCWMLMARL